MPEQTAEAADLSEDFGPMRSPNEPLDSTLQAIAELDVNAGAGVGLVLFCHPEQSEGSRNACEVPRFARNDKRKPAAYFSPAKSVGCFSSARALARDSRFSMMNLSSSGLTGRG